MIALNRLGGALRNRPRSVASLSAQFGVNPAKVYHQLRGLLRAGRVRLTTDNLWSIA